MPAHLIWSTGVWADAKVPLPRCEGQRRDGRREQSLIGFIPASPASYAPGRVDLLAARISPLTLDIPASSSVASDPEDDAAFA